MKNKINAAGECTGYMNYPCHEVIKLNSPMCKECIEAQRLNEKDKQDAIIKHFETGKSLTKVQSFQNFNYWNLGDIVYKLRKRHAPDYILTEMKTNHVSGSRFAVYQKNPKYDKK